MLWSDGLCPFQIYILKSNPQGDGILGGWLGDDQVKVPPSFSHVRAQ